MPVWLDFNDCWRSFLCKLFYISTQLFKVRKRSFGVRTRVWDFFGRDFTGLHRPSRCLHSFSECLHHAYTGFWNAYTIPTPCLHHAYTAYTFLHGAYTTPTLCLHRRLHLPSLCLHYAYPMPTRCLPYAYPMPTLFQFLIKRGEGRPPPHLPPPKPGQGRTAHKRLTDIGGSTTDREIPLRASAPTTPNTQMSRLWFVESKRVFSKETLAFGRSVCFGRKTSADQLSK